MHGIVDHASLLKRVAFIALTGLAASPLLAAWFLPDGPSRNKATDNAPIRTVALQPDSGDAGPARLVIEVKGRGFLWQFRDLTPGRESTSPDQTTNGQVLWLPVGTHVEFHLTSDDYIYFFSVPELDIRQIAVPGMTHKATCVVAEPLIHDLRVDALCGFPFYHDEWMGRIVARPGQPFAKIDEANRNAF